MKWDYEYVSKGIADVFMVFEPLGARRHVREWQYDRNRRCSTCGLRFATDDARVKLKRLYPKIEVN